MSNVKRRVASWEVTGDFWKPVRRRATNTCAPMPAIRAHRRWRRSKPIITFPHVKGRGEEAQELRRDSKKKARRWVVEVAHSWFNRLRKLLVRYEKLERSFLGLNQLAAAIIAFRKVPLKVNIIYG